MNFFEVLDAADNLTVEEQLEMSEILHNRAVDFRRDIIKAEIEAARQEHNSGKLRPQSVEGIMKDILSEI